MKAIRFEDRSIHEVDIPVPGLETGEALVRVLTAGICATDMALLQGYAGFDGIPGHEFVGIVEKCPERPGLAGKRVVADINTGCGCTPDPRHCPHRRTLGIRGQNGAFAEYVVVSANNLHPVADAIQTRHAVLAEPLAAALEISQQVHITHRERVGVVGDGCLGLLTAISMRHCSGRVTLVGRHPDKLSIAWKQGVETILAHPGDTPEQVAAKTGKFDVTVDATGNPQGLDWCIPLTRPEGRVVVKTTTPEKPSIDMAAVVVNELVLQGSRCGDMSLALDYLEYGRIDVEPLIEAVYPFTRFRDAFWHASKKGGLKVLLDFSA